MKSNLLILRLVEWFQRLLPYLQDAVMLFVRVTIGWQFFLSGKGKLNHLDNTTDFFASLGIPAPGFHAGMVGGIEMIGGLLLVLGLASRVAAVPLTGSMIVAYLTAHREDAFKSISDFGDQAPYAFLLASLVVLAFGPGRVSLDAWLFRRFKPRTTGSASLQGE